MNITADGFVLLSNQDFCARILNNKSDGFDLLSNQNFRGRNVGNKRGLRNKSIPRSWVQSVQRTAGTRHHKISLRFILQLPYCVPTALLIQETWGFPVLEQIIVTRFLSVHQFHLESGSKVWSQNLKETLDWYYWDTRLPGWLED